MNLFFVKVLLWCTRLVSPKYYHKDFSYHCHVVEYREYYWENPFTGKSMPDFRITYLTKDGKFYTLSEDTFYKFYVRKV